MAWAKPFCMRLILHYCFTLFLLVVFITACNSGYESPVEGANPSMDTFAVIEDDITTPETIVEDTIIHPRFMALARYLDSIGYAYDLARYDKIYGGRHSTKKDINNNVRYVDGYPFIKIDFQHSLIHQYAASNSYGFSNHNGSRWDIDTLMFDKVVHIMLYFAQEKEHSNFRVDGIIEQWHFPDTLSAYKAAKELGLKSSYVLWKTGAHVSWAGNDMYIFRTRACAFCHIIEKWHKHFVSFPGVTNMDNDSLHVQVRKESNAKHKYPMRLVNDQEIISAIGDSAKYYTCKGSRTSVTCYLIDTLPIKCGDKFFDIILSNGKKLPINYSFSHDYRKCNKFIKANKTFNFKVVNDSIKDFEVSPYY